MLINTHEDKRNIEVGFRTKISGNFSNLAKEVTRTHTILPFQWGVNSPPMTDENKKVIRPVSKRKYFWHKNASCTIHNVL